MSLPAAIKNIFILLAVLSFNSFGLVVHASAMSTTPHEMNGMSHDSSNAGSCAALCRTAVISEQESGTIDNEGEDDNEPTVLPYEQVQPPRTDEKSIAQMLYDAEIKPPPKVPLYILHSIFRV